jgi:hypothetical protein
MKLGRTSLAAGEMCRVLIGYMEADVPYRGQDEHLGFLVDYLRRLRWIQWRTKDLRSVAAFLMSVLMTRQGDDGTSRHADPAGVEKLLAKLVAKGRAKFPDEAYFQFLAGEMEIRKGPRKCRRKLARSCFQRAVQLLEGSSEADDSGVAKRAKERLLFLNEHERRPREMMPPLPPPGGNTAAAKPDDLLDKMQGNGGGPDMRAGTLFDMSMRACRELGADPREVLDEMSGGRAFRFRAEPSRKGKE